MIGIESVPSDCAFSEVVSSRRGEQSSIRSRTPSDPNRVNKGTAIAPSFMVPNKRSVECQRRLQHDRHAVAGRDAHLAEPMRIARRLLGDGAESDRFVMPVGMSDTDGDAVRIG